MILEYARRGQFVIFTQDEDFLKFDASRAPHAGIIYSKQGRRIMGEVVRFLKLVSE